MPPKEPCNREGLLDNSLPRRLNAVELSLEDDGEDEDDAMLLSVWLSGLLLCTIDAVLLVEQALGMAGTQVFVPEIRCHRSELFSGGCAYLIKIFLH